MADDVPAGLYEIVVTKALENRLLNVDQDLVRRHSLRAADAADRIALLIARQVERALDAVPDADRVAIGGDVAQRLLAALGIQLPRTDPPSSPPCVTSRSATTAPPAPPTSPAPPAKPTAAHTT